MAYYTEKTWVDRTSEYPMRRTLTYADDGTTRVATIERNEGTVTAQGDAFSALNMNGLEGRINLAFQNVETDIGNIATVIDLINGEVI